jgi:hypothetical protein
LDELIAATPRAWHERCYVLDVPQRRRAKENRKREKHAPNASGLPAHPDPTELEDPSNAQDPDGRTPPDHQRGAADEGLTPEQAIVERAREQQSPPVNPPLDEDTGDR